MAAGNRALSFTFTTEDQQAIASLKRIEKGFKGLDVQVDKTRRGGSTFGSTFAGLALGAGALYSIDEAEQAEVAERKMAAAIEATGNAAGVSAAEQQKYADELGKKIALDNDDVSLAETRLRKYKEIKDERFYETMGLAADYAASKEVDLTAATDTLGKALNNPLKASKLLRTAGVELTAAQNDQIKAMMEAGDVAGAQGVILDELHGRYDGAAEAAVTGSQRAKVAMGETAESAGKVLAPGMELAADGLGLVADGLGHLPGPLQTATVGALGLAYAGPKVVDGLSKIGPTVTKVGDSLGSVSSKSASAGKAVGGFLERIGPGGVAAGAVGIGIISAAFVQMQTESDRAKQNVSDLQHQIDAGATPAQASIEKLANTLAGIDGGFAGLKGSSDQFRDSLHDVGISATEAAELITAPQDEWERRSKEILNTSGESKHAMSELVTNLNLMRDAHNEATESKKIQKQVEGELAGKIGETNEKTKTAAGNTADLAAKEADLAEKVPPLTQQWVDHADALERVNTETEKLLQGAFDEFEANEKYEQSVTAVTAAQAELALIRKQGDPAKIKEAEEKLSDAIADQVKAKGDQATATAEANGQSITAADVAEIQRTELENLRTTTGLYTTDLDVLLVRLTQVTNQHKLLTDQMIWNEAVAANARREAANGSAPLPGTPGATVPPSRDPDAGLPTSKSTRGGFLGVTVHAPNLRTVAPGKKQLDTALNRASKWQAGSQSVMTP